MCVKEDVQCSRFLSVWYIVDCGFSEFGCLWVDYFVRQFSVLQDCTAAVLYQSDFCAPCTIVYPQNLVIFLQCGFSSITVHNSIQEAVYMCWHALCGLIYIGGAKTSTGYSYLFYDRHIWAIWMLHLIHGITRITDHCHLPAQQLPSPLEWWICFGCCLS